MAANTVKLLLESVLLVLLNAGFYIIGHKVKNLFRLTGPAEAEVVGYYRHADVCPLTGALRA